MLKKITFTLYAIVIAVMAMATFIEKTEGTPFVLSNFYGSWWFCVLWGIMAIFAIIYFFKRKVKKISTILLHASFILILIGALLTHLTAWQGYVHLRQSMPVQMCTVEESNDTHIKELPFTITLDTFQVQCYKGTDAPSDYISKFTITTHNEKLHGNVSMNNIFSYNDIRFYQTSYDPDLLGSTLSINSDPWGIPVTYIGYGLLFLSMLIMLINPKDTFRKILSKASSHNYIITFIVLCPLFANSNQANASTTLSQSQAESFGHLCINYNDRVCPVQTLAIDFTRKIHGSSSYEDYTAEQVLAGFIFFSEEWNKEPIIRIKNKQIRDRFNLPEYTAATSLFNDRGYILGPSIQEYYQGQNDKFHEEIMKLDDILILIMQMSHYEQLRIFPYESKWYSPTDSLPSTIEQSRKDYFHNSLALIAQNTRKGNTKYTDEMIYKLSKYQLTYGAKELPSPLQLNSEFIYNSIPFAKILFMLCLTFAFISLIQKRWLNALSLTVLIITELSLTLCLSLRWIISGTIPMTNGYETMILMTWIICLASLLLYRKFRIILTFGLMLSGFFLLVAHLGQMDPKISNVMPVLASPLLSIHVSCVMMAYGLLSITFACGVYGLIIKKKSDEMHLLSQLMLYPGVFLLSAGIFIGAIWANVSWGRYWGWDPKEVWALITLLIYALAMHSQSLKWIRSPKHYHIYMIISFFTILITYFGVNFFLGGMHSYANS